MTQYKLIDNGCVGYTINDVEFYFDRDDTEKVIAHEWFIDEKGYVTLVSSKSSTVYLHESLLNETDPSVIIHHIDGNKLNNRKSNLKKIITNPNNGLYEVIGSICIGRTKNGEKFMIDSEDLPRVMQHVWYKDKRSGYIATSIKFSNQKSLVVYLQYFVMKVLAPRVYVYHIDKNPTNNRKSNLKRSEYAYDFEEVCFDENRNKWKVSIGVNGKRKMIGRYKTEQEAIKALNNAKDIFCYDHITSD